MLLSRLFRASVIAVAFMVLGASVTYAQSVALTPKPGPNVKEATFTSTATNGGNYNVANVVYELGTNQVVNGQTVYVQFKNSGIQLPNAKYTFTGLTSNTTYICKVKATFNWAGPGPPPAGPPPVPPSVTASDTRAIIAP